METTLIKICGITRPEDVAVCVESGVDYVGINLFSGSGRFVEFEKCRGWLRQFENQVQRVAVVVRPKWEDIQRWASSGCFDMVQLHGEESAEEIVRIRGLGLPLIYAVKSEPTCHRLSLDVMMMCKHILIDSASSGAFGGTGTTIPLDTLNSALTSHQGFSCFVAGGLNPDNVSKVARLSGVRGVDVAGGVEERPGIKSSLLIKAFVNAVKSEKSYSHES